MIDATTYHHIHGYYSAADLVEEGWWLLTALSKKAKGDALARGLLRLFSPLGTRQALAIILDRSDAEFCEMWLRGPSTPDETGYVWLPNPFFDESELTRTRLVSILRDGGKLLSLISSLGCPLQLPSRDFVRKWFAARVEALLPQLAEPLLVGAAADSVAVAWPREIDLEWTSGLPYSQRSERRVAATRYYRHFAAALARLSKQSRQASTNFTLFVPTTGAGREIDRLAVAILQHLVAHSPRRRGVIRQSAMRVWQEIPWVLSRLAQRNLPKEGLSPNARTALHAIAASGLAQRLIEKNPGALQIPAVSEPIETILVGLGAFERRYRLAEYPSLDDEPAAATRVATCLLWEGGRRSKCLSDVTPRDFKGQLQDLEVHIPTTKVHGMNDAMCPVGVLASEESARYMSAWSERCRTRGTERRRLLELALAREVPRTGPAAWAALARQIRTVFELNETPDLHDYRRACVTWLPVRMMLAAEPSLRDHSVLDSSRSSPLLDLKALQHLARYLDRALPLDDPLELVAGIIGNLRPREIRRTYCRSWPLLIALRCRAIWKRAGVD